MSNDNTNAPAMADSTDQKNALGDSIFHTPSPDGVEPPSTEVNYDVIEETLSSSRDDLKQIPVSFAVALPEVRLPLAQVKELYEGQSIHLNLDLTEDMSILVNGKVLGNGKLVQIGDKVGIKIKEWLPT